MKALVCIALIVSCFLISSVNCQDDGSLWDNVKETWKSFVENIKSLWNRFKEEIRARTADVSGWTQEAWNTFKTQMRDWVEQRNDVDEAEKEDMRNYIEKLQMPEENKI